jgi:electron transport complex protein RnfG
MESIRMIFIMTLFSALSALALAAFNRHTQPIIKAAQKSALVGRQIKKVVTDLASPDPCKPSKAGFDNDPANDSVCIGGTEVFRCKKSGKSVGYAFKTIGENAYSGTLTCLVGITPDGKVTGLEIVQHKETPGLGAEATKCEWRRQLIGKKPSEINWSVKQDGGDVDAISGATITSRSVINCVTKAHEFAAAHKDEIETKSPTTEECNGK